MLTEKEGKMENIVCFYLEEGCVYKEGDDLLRFATMNPFFDYSRFDQFGKARTPHDRPEEGKR